MSLLKNYWTWLVLLVLLMVFLAVQFWYVPDKVAAIREENRSPVQKFQGLENLERNTRSRGSGGLPTAGDLEAIRRHSRLFHESVVKIRTDWRQFTDGLNAHMSNGRNAKGEIFDPTTAKDGAPGEPIQWNLFAATLDGLYRRTFAESERLMAEAVAPKLELMLSDQFFAADVTYTRQTATERAKRRVAAMAPVLGKVVENAASINPVDVGDRFDVNADPAEIERGWSMWRHYLIVRDLLTRVLPTVRAEIDTTVMCYLPTGDAERSEHVRAMETDDLPAGLMAKREPKAIKETRFVERIRRLEISPPELGRDKLDAVGEVFTPKAADGTPAPADAPAGGMRFGAPAGGSVGGAGSFYDRYTVEMEVFAHPQVLIALQEKLLNSAKDAGMFYEPVSMSIRRLPDEATRPGGTADLLRAAMLGEDAPAASAPPPEPMTGPDGLYSDRRTRPAVVDDPGDLHPLDTVNRYDREAAVEAVLVYHLYRFRYLNTDNETYRAPEAAPGFMGF